MTYIFFSVVVSWLVAQLAKVAGSGKFKSFFNPGGMPSSHSALVGALATSVGIQQGFSSALFYVCLAFGIIVVHDAIKIRKQHTFVEVAAGILIGVLASLLLFYWV